MIAGKVGFFRSSFTPTQIGTMTAWYDFSDNSTITTVSSLISQVTNKSGSAPTLSQGTAANRPGLTTINGVQAASFNGSTTLLFSNTAVVPTGTLFCVASSTSNALNQNICCFSTSAAALTSLSIGGFWGTGSQGIGASYRYTGSGGTSQIINSGVGGAAIALATYATPTSFAMRVNGVAYGGAYTGNLTSNQSAASIGAVNVNGTYIRYMTGSVGEVLFYPAVLSSTDIASVEKYLSAKWGISI